MKNLIHVVMLLVLVIMSLTKPIWFDALTEHTREPFSKSKVVYLELDKQYTSNK